LGIVVIFAWNVAITGLVMGSLQLLYKATGINLLRTNPIPIDLECAKKNIEIEMEKTNS
jgi:hypothetical protein